MNSETNPALLADLHYALDVMEEYSHLGLDDEGANSLRRILLRRIAEAESALTRRSVASVSSISAGESKVSA
jgi:hypothetical protein